MRLSHDTVIIERVGFCADSKLILDFFIDAADTEDQHKLHKLTDTDADTAADGAATSWHAADDAELTHVFTAIRSMITEDVIKAIQAVYIFDLKGCVACIYH